MTAVNTIDGIVYGFRLLGYILGVVLIGGVFVLVGVAIRGVSGGLAILIGFAVIYAGTLGTLYKVIADGVEAGTLAVETAGDGDEFQSQPDTTTTDGGGNRVSHPEEGPKAQLMEAIQATDPSTTEAIAEYVGKNEQIVEKWLTRYKDAGDVRVRWLGGSKVWNIDDPRR